MAALLGLDSRPATHDQRFSNSPFTRHRPRIQMRPIIRVENLGKQYQIGGPRKGYQTLRETLSEAARRPLHWLQSQRKRIDATIWALKDVSFELRQGDALGIVGHNGAGKSTLLKILSRITEPSRGHVDLFGKLSSLLEVGTGFHPELTGRENIFLNGVILGMPRREIHQKFDAIVSYSGVEEFLDTPVKRYSSGMYVRLAFAVAVHMTSDILLLDEVLAVGDKAFQHKCIQTIAEIAQGGRSVILVSHNILSVRQLCNRAIWLDHGRVNMSGAANDVCNAYQNTHSSISGPKGCRATRHTKHIGGAELFISSVELTNASGEPSATFDYSDVMVIHLTIDGTAMEPQYSAEYYIRDTLTQLVSVGASGPHHGHFFDRAIRRLRIRIGPLTLTQGQYTLSFSLMSSERRTDTWEGAISFSVENCQPYGRTWNIKSPEEGACIQLADFSAPE